MELQHGQLPVPRRLLPHVLLRVRGLQVEAGQHEERDFVEAPPYTPRGRLAQVEARVALEQRLRFQSLELQPEP